MTVMNRTEFSRQTLTTLPNVLTYTRMATIPVIVILMSPPATSDSLNLACLLFVLAAFTDYLDGILARRHNQVTSVGKLLDPLADKLLTCAVLIMLISIGKIQAWLAFLIIGREIAITGLRTIAATQGLIIDAGRMGKNKMVSQTIALVFLMPSIPKVEWVLQWTGLTFLWVSVVLGYWSAIDYFALFIKEAKRRSRQKE